MADYARAAVKSNTSLQLLNAIQSLVLSLGLLAVVFLAGWQVVHHAMTAGAITACILIIQTVFAPLGNLGVNYRMIPQAFIDMEQMLELRAILPEITDRRTRATCRRLRPGAPTLVFDNVTFGTTPARLASQTSASARRGHDHRPGRPVRRRQDHLGAAGAAADRSPAGRARCGSTALTCAR
ncbi:MAG: hypothetical protein WDM85_07285 [Caulobacteraceae bacterium]